MPRPAISHLLFDLDETLYPRGTGVMRCIGQRIGRYIEEYLGYSAQESQQLRRQYFEMYGTTMRGLVLHHDLDADHFLQFVHDVPLDSLAENPELDRMIACLPGEKVIFTNADKAHAERVLIHLGMRDRFTRIIDVVAVNYVSKPAPEAYTACLDILNANPARCVLIEDRPRNLVPATELGMATVLVDGDPGAVADYHIADILDLGPVIADLREKRDWQETL
ncbi:MAG: pyrimidine 5'-nucleotidase [Chloroflexota bacterium]|nr:pyrimidine 5'-nucleotidase [Chloroflexota bacterium]